MKKPISLLCICMALVLLASSVGVALLPAGHGCCMQEGCTVCLLTSVMKRVLNSILLIVATTLALALPSLGSRAVGRRPRVPYPSADTPVDRMDKMSN